LNYFAGGATSGKGHAFARRHRFLIRMPRPSFKNDMEALGKPEAAAINPELELL
jgi:hypothetical protein